jgi:hypothetical protein
MCSYSTNGSSGAHRGPGNPDLGQLPPSKNRGRFTGKPMNKDNLDALRPKARTSDPATSHVAADSMRDIALTHAEKIHASLTVSGDQTIYELEKSTGIEHVAIARRMKDLERAKTVERVPDIARLSPTGRPCTVWRAMP